jgi:putative colanic acid biosynthesis acetyltransferase WcaF
MNNLRTDLSKYDNSWYSPKAGMLKRGVWYIVNVLFFINPLNGISSLKVFLLRLFGGRIGKGVMLKPSVNIKYPWLLEVGDFSWIGEKVWIDNLVKVKIGKNCCLSQGAMLLAGNHNYSKVTFDLIVEEIILEDGVWIGAQSVVCPGVTCKNHSILSVQSVASSNLDAYTIYRGNPAIAIKKRIITE